MRTTTQNDQLFGAEHVARYRETGGDEGHDWRGTTTLLLTTTGRRSGEEHTTPLIYQPHADDFLIVASNGGAPEPPGWYLNLRRDPNVEVQVRGEVFHARARIATADEKPELWRIMTGVWPDYDDYQRKTDREIPVVVLERARVKAAEA
jgi:deazaflavin-dependent oxidoreductase (nitroreductase family)